MNTLQQVLAAAGALVALAGVAGVLFAIARSSNQDARIDRLSKENDEYVRRLNYLEPKYDALKREVETLHKLHNPADQIRELKEQEQDNHDEAMGRFDALTAAIQGKSS